MLGFFPQFFSTNRKLQMMFQQRYELLHNFQPHLSWGIHIIFIFFHIHCVPTLHIPYLFSSTTPTTSRSLLSIISKYEQCSFLLHNYFVFMGFCSSCDNMFFMLHSTFCMFICFSWNHFFWHNILLLTPFILKSIVYLHSSFFFLLMCTPFRYIQFSLPLSFF
jgi:hypothetical protein